MKPFDTVPVWKVFWQRLAVIQFGASGTCKYQNICSGRKDIIEFCNFNASNNDFHLNVIWCLLKLFKKQVFVMLIKCQTNTQKFQENALLTKASACHKPIEEFCMSCAAFACSLLRRHYDLFSFLLQEIHSFTMYFFFFCLFSCYWWAYPISSYNVSLLAVEGCWIYLDIKFRPLTDIQHGFFMPQLCCENVSVNMC